MGERWIGRALLATTGLVLALLAAASPAYAVLQVVNPDDVTDVRTIDANGDIQPDATGHEFFAEVQACLDELKAHPHKLQIIIDLVNAPNDPARIHTIERTNGGSSNRTRPPNANESNGTGAGSQTFWNPNNNTFPVYPCDMIPRDACGAFLHELVHAHDKNAGIMDRSEVPTNDDVPPDRVRISEIRACQAQNWFSQSKGMASRRKYGADELPRGVQFDRCPDAICIFADSGAISYPVTDVTDLYYEVPGTQAPGRAIEIKDGQGATVGHVVLVKRLDGQVVIRLTCDGIDPVNVTAIQWKNDGVPLTSQPQDLANPLSCDLSNPEAESPPMALPDVPTLVVVKGPDDTTVAANGMITFQITVRNEGDEDLMNVMVSDPNFPGCDFAIANLPRGASETRTCMVMVGANTFRNQAQASAQSPGSGGRDVGPVVDYARVKVN